MKTKHLFKLLLLLLIISFLPSTFTVQAKPEKEKNPSSTLTLKGLIQTKGLRSGSDIISVTIMPSGAEVAFHKELEEVSVTLKNASGVIFYSTIINTETQSYLFIPFQGLTKGKYTILFKNERGKMWGEFEI